MVISCFDAETKLNELGIPAKYHAWETQTNHLYRGKIYNAGASFIVKTLPISWSCGLADPTMYHSKPQPLSIEALTIIKQVVDTKNWRLKSSLEEALRFFAQEAELNYWGCKVGDIIRFTTNRAFSFVDQTTVYRALITKLEHGSNQHFTYYHATLLNTNEHIRWSKASYDRQFVLEN